MTENEYNECVNQYADSVYRFVLKNLQHPANAKDVVQQSFEKLWVNRKLVDNLKCKSYLFTIAYHQLIDCIRKNKKVVLKENFLEVIHNSEAPKENSKRILNEALETLDEKQRSLVMLKDYEGYSYLEIGQIMNLTESQVKVYLHRARLQLRDYIIKIENII